MMRHLQCKKSNLGLDYRRNAKSVAVKQDELSEPRCVICFFDVMRYLDPMKIILGFKVAGGRSRIIKKVELPSVPRVGEWIEYTEGWTLAEIKEVTWWISAPPELTLNETMNESEVKELLELGWSMA